MGLGLSRSIRFERPTILTLPTGCFHILKDVYVIPANTMTFGEDENRAFEEELNVLLEKYGKKELSYYPFSKEEREEKRKAMSAFVRAREEIREAEETVSAAVEVLHKPPQER